MGPCCRRRRRRARGMRSCRSPGSGFERTEVGSRDPDLPSADVGLEAAAFLVGASFLPSMPTGALGLGGGVTMLALLATLLPPLLVIPEHGIVQIGSDLGRAVPLRQAVAAALLGAVAAGSILGVGLGGLLLTELPEDPLLLSLGLFALWSSWSPRLRPHASPPAALTLVGTATSFVTGSPGATGLSWRRSSRRSASTARARSPLVPPARACDTRPRSARSRHSASPCCPGFRFRSRWSGSVFSARRSARGCPTGCSSGASRRRSGSSAHSSHSGSSGRG